MSTTEGQEAATAARLMGGSRALTLEQKKKKYPLEFTLKAQYEEYLQVPTPKLEAGMYETLCKLSEAVVMYKYGPGSRIDMETLPHEVASSVFITIIMRKKVVYSWTNLLKKVVRDYVSNHFRKEYYDKAPTVSIHELTSDLDLEDGSQEAHFFERVENTNGFRPEDLIYVDQRMNQVARRMSAYCKSACDLRSYIIATWALTHALSSKRPRFSQFLDAKGETLYQLHLSQLQRMLRSLSRIGYDHG